MKNKIIFLFCIVLSSCFAFDSADMHVVDDIYVFCLDGKVTLSRKVDEHSYHYLIQEEVYAIWNNDSIVMVKRHPLMDEWHVNRDSTNYYVVIIDKECDERGFYNDSVIGPLNEKELILQKDSLGIKEDIKFRDVNL